jgi:serine/threonine-protein kinase
MLTEELPFRGSAGSLHFQVLHTDPPSPRKLNESVPRDLETICLKCLEKDAAKRYQTAQELADELRRFQRGEPILSRPISRAERAWRWCRRHPMSAIAAGLLAVIAVASPIVAIRERLHSLESNKLLTDNGRLIQQLTGDRDELRRQLDVQSELRPFQEQARVSPSRSQFMRIAYDQYQPKVEQMLSAGTPDDRCLARLGLAILAKGALPTEQALPTLLKARDELESAAKNSADNRQLSAALASCYDSLGDLYGWSDQPTLARDYCQRAEIIWNRLAQTEPTLANYDALAENQFNIVRLKIDAGSSERALSRVADAKKPLSEQLDAFFPPSPKQLYETACALANCRPWLTQNQTVADPPATPTT